MRHWMVAIALAALTLVAPSAHTHSVLESSSPASGSVVERSPEQIGLSFREPTMLTYLAVVSTSGERRLTFAPVGVAEAFTASTPELIPGRNELQWRALSKDGHVVEGSIIIVVKPPAH